MTAAVDLTRHLPDHAPYRVVADGEDRPAWLAARKAFLCASESACILGTSPWGSKLSVWAEKTGRVSHADEQAEWMFWGSVLEPAIIRGYGLRTGRAAVPFNMLVQSQKYPWMAATPDALCTDDPDAAKRLPVIRRRIGLIRMHLRMGRDPAQLVHALAKETEGWWPLQTKNIGHGSAEHWAEGIPIYYRAQCIHEALVMGATRTTGAALISGQRLAWDDVDLDVDDILTRQVVNLGDKFWREHVLADVEPETDASQSARRTLDALYPQHEPEKVVAFGGELLDIAERLDALKLAQKEAAEAQSLLDNQVRQMMQDAERAVLPDGSGFTLKTDVNGARRLLRKKAKSK